MMHSFIFTKSAYKEFSKLPDDVKERIEKKLKRLKSHQDIFSILKHLHNFEPASHRLRVGSYRLILELRHQQNKDCEFWVLDLGDRKDVYN